MTISLRMSRRKLANGFVFGGLWALLVVPLAGAFNLLRGIEDPSPILFMLMWGCTFATPIATWAIAALILRPVATIARGRLDWRTAGTTSATTVHGADITSVTVAQVDGVTYLDIRGEPDVKLSLPVEWRGDFNLLEHRIRSLLWDGPRLSDPAAVVPNG